MLFTSVIARVNQVASEAFRDHGNTTDVPCAVSDSRIYPLGPDVSKDSAYVLSRVGHLISATIEVGKKVYLDAPAPSIQKTIAKADSPFPRPQLGVSFGANNNKETISSEMEKMGFIKVASGRSSYYLGGASPPNMKRCSELGADADCYVGQAHANLKGVIAFDIISALVINFCSIPHFNYRTFLHKEKGMQDSDADFREWLEVEERDSPFVGSANRPTDDGHFFPYFETLLLADKSIVPRVLSTIIQDITGPNRSIMPTLIKGWASLCTTEAGLMLSHMVFGMMLAIQTAGNLRLYVSGSAYNGFILSTPCDFIKNTTIHRSLLNDNLCQEMMDYDAHDSALSKICSILSAMPIGDDEEKKVVSARSISTPRQIHDHMRERVFTSGGQVEMMKLLSKLSFAQIYWEASSVDHIVVAMNTIGQGHFLGSTEPIPFKNMVMFTKDPVLSTLAAFGNRVPTLTDRGEHSLSIPKKAESMFTGKTGSLLLGFAIFVKPLQQAMEAWKDMRKTGVITFNGNVKKDAIHYRNAKSLVPKDSEKGLAIKRALVQHFSIAQQDKVERKRRREERDNEKEEERAAKRHEREREENDDLMDIYN